MPRSASSLPAEQDLRPVKAPAQSVRDVGHPGEGRLHLGSVCLGPGQVPTLPWATCWVPGCRWGGLSGQVSLVDARDLVQLPGAPCGADPGQGHLVEASVRWRLVWMVQGPRHLGHFRPPCGVPRAVRLRTQVAPDKHTPDECPHAPK